MIRLLPPTIDVTRVVHLRHPEVRAKRASKGDGPGVRGPHPSRPAFGGHLRMTGRERACINIMQAFAALFFVCGSLVLGTSTLAQPAEPRQKITIGYVEIEGDKRYEPIMAERVVLKAREHPFDGG